jgi:hypothetical protein
MSILVVVFIYFAGLGWRLRKELSPNSIVDIEDMLCICIHVHHTAIHTNIGISCAQSIGAAGNKQENIKVITNSS